MEEYKSYLISRILNCKSKSLEELEQHCSKNKLITINRNEYGQLHSKYLDDRYEPAISFKSTYRQHDYYLFDGDIKDCVHPICVKYYRGQVIQVIYYSSERIKRGEPNIITNSYAFYNRYNDFKTIIDGYESKLIGCEEKISYCNLLDGFSLLCEEMDIFKFRFAD